MLFPGISYSWVLAGVSGGLGLQGTQKRQCLTPEPAALHCFSALTILHVRNWFQKEAPSSKLNRTPPANPRHIFTRAQDTCPQGAIPLATAPAEHPGFIPGCVLTLPRPPHTQAHQAISDVLITAKPPHGHSPSQGGKIWDLRQMSPLPLGSTNTCMA